MSLRSLNSEPESPLERVLAFSGGGCQEAGKEKIWGAHVLRLVSHLDEMDTWAPLRRESRDFRTATFTRFLEQGGQIIGIENVGAARSLELIPTITLSETGNRTRAIPRAAALANPSFPSRSRGRALITTRCART